MFIDNNADLKAKLKHVDFLLVLTRGGLAVGAFLSYLLNIKDIEVIKVESYDKHEKGTVTIEQKDLSIITGKKLLIVDDICDTGDSLLQTTKYIEKHYNPNSIETFTVIKALESEKTVYAPDYYMYEPKNHEWINFAWDNENLNLADWIIAR